ncbi:endonuclease III domain-containing protein [candidate division KSB1 bacterium]
MTGDLKPGKLITAYRIMLNHFGKRNWWPADSRFEIMIGSILVQNTNWKNVGRCIENLKKEGLMKPEILYGLPVERLAELIKPSGYYNQKVKKIRAFLEFYRTNSGFSIESMLQKDNEVLRKELLGVFGIGNETADCIMLYALDKSCFVVDNYTRRIFSRAGLVSENIRYNTLRAVFTENIPVDVELYKEFHKLIIYLGKEFCKASMPKCRICVMRKLCRTGSLNNTNR